MMLSLEGTGKIVDSFYFFLFNGFIFSLLLPLQPLPKLIASSMNCSYCY